jgi:hypothetical protein
MRQRLAWRVVEVFSFADPKLKQHLLYSAPKLRSTEEHAGKIQD